MANLAKEARDKVQEQWPGASVHSRGPGWIKHQHPTDPARFVVDSHIGPIHYGISQDQEIDTAWQPTAGAWQFEMITNDHQTFARDIFNVGNLFQFQKDGHALNFDPQSINWIDENTSRQQIAIKQAVAAQVNDDTLSFTEAYGPGRHFKYQNQTSRLQKLITIDNLTDLPTPTVQGNEIWFEAEFSLSLSSGINFWIDGQEWARANNTRVQTANLIEVRDTATGSNVLWWLGYPRATDSDGNEIIGQIEVRRQGGPSSLFICVRIPHAWIEAATFPVFIDPTIDTQVGASADDAQENASGVSSYTTNSFLIDNRDEWQGMRWTGVTIPAGATIDAATVDVVVVGSGFDEPDLELRFEDASAPVAFDGGSSDISSRTYTTASAALNSADLGASGGEWLSTLITLPELKTLVQELVDSYDYSSGSSMVYTHRGAVGIAAGRDFAMYFYDNDSAQGAKLHIEYTTGGGDLSVNVSESVTVGESTTVAHAAAMASSVSDSVTIGESITMMQTSFVSVSDSVTTGESVTVAISTLEISVLESITIGESETVILPDALSLSVSDSVTIGESVDGDVSDSQIDVSDSVTIGESADVAIGDLLISVADGITTGESVDATISDLLVNVSDSVTVGESVNVSIVTAGLIQVNVSDSVAIGESVTVAMDDMAVSVADSVTIGESVSVAIVAFGTLSISVSDSVTIGESVTVDPLSLAVDVTDAVTIGESVTVALVGAAYLINVTDSITISEAVYLAFFITPLCRTYAISAESRVYSVPFESRVYAVPEESRVLEVNC